MMQLLWTLEAIYDYIEANNPIVALALDGLFAEQAGHLVDHPGLGRPGRVSGPRELIAHSTHRGV